MTTAQEAHISHLDTAVLQCLVVNWRFYTSFLIGAQSVLMRRAIRDERPDMSLLVPLSYNKASAGDEGSARLRSDES